MRKGGGNSNAGNPARALFAGRIARVTKQKAAPTDWRGFAKLDVS